MLKIRECNRCHWEWASRHEKEPKECPHCKTRYWNRARKYKTAERMAEA